MFYARMFDQNPSFRPLFKGDMKLQKIKLGLMLANIAKNAHRFKDVHPELYRLGKRHIAYNVTEEMFPKVGETLLWVLKTALKDRFTEEHAKAWQRVYDLAADVVIDAMRKESAKATGLMSLQESKRSGPSSGARRELVDFPARAQAEVIRLMMHYVGLDYENVEIDTRDWPKVKPTTPFGVVPVLYEYDGDKKREYSETLAILKHIARTSKRGYGVSEDEQTRTDMIAEWLKTHYETKILPCKDAEARAVYYRESFPELAAGLERLLTQSLSGFLVGSEPTYADLMAFGILELIQQTNADALNGNVKLSAFLNKVRAVPAIGSYLAGRRMHSNMDSNASALVPATVPTSSRDKSRHALKYVAFGSYSLSVVALGLLYLQRGAKASR